MLMIGSMGAFLADGVSPGALGVAGETGRGYRLGPARGGTRLGVRAGARRYALRTRRSGR